MLEFIQENYVIFLMPFVSAIIGWGTNILALKMTFYPLEFLGFTIKGYAPIGWKGLPPIGWQGIIPSKAEKMASIATDMITTKLIDIEEQFGQINPEIIAKELESSMLRLARQVTDEVMTEHVPMWKMMPTKNKEIVYERASKEIPLVIEKIMQEVKVNISEVFDLKKMVIDFLLQNKALMNRIFLEVGDKEFQFIERSGFGFGFGLGVLQAVIFFYYRANWQLPVGGLVIGYLTNILALRMIFSPVNPIFVFGYRIQGLFIKRQKEVAGGYAKLIADNIMTMDNVFNEMFNGDGADKLKGIIRKHSNEGIDRTAGFSSVLIRMTSGADTYDEIKDITVNRFIDAAPDQINLVFGYVKEALDIEETLSSKMSALPPDEFVDFLRPVFQEDEWKLIGVGALLGLVAGLLQLLMV